MSNDFHTCAILVNESDKPRGEFFSSQTLMMRREHKACADLIGSQVDIPDELIRITGSVSAAIQEGLSHTLRSTTDAAWNAGFRKGFEAGRKESQEDGDTEEVQS